MPSVESPPNNLRRIAVLVASVDAATARQLLLQLPTEIAKQVRATLQSLGPIDPAERQRIVSEFQSTAARQVRSVPHNRPDSQNSTAVNRSQQTEYAAEYPVVQPSSLPLHTPLNSAVPSALNPTAWPNYPNATLDASPNSVGQPTETKATWKRMDTRALSRFLAGERPTVIAVVISQLMPELGVALLQQLPLSLHSDVLQRLVHLKDIDVDAMQTIDDHLAERLKDYEHQVNSETESSRRLASLIAVAPAPLQQQWLKLLRDANADPANTSNDPAQHDPANVPHSTDPQATVGSPASKPNPSTYNIQNSLDADMFSSVITTADMPVAATQNSTASTDGVSLSQVASDADESHILPFPGPSSTASVSNVDRSLLQLDFESILQLKSPQLAQVLTQAESQTVLLALAGATPAFMKRFYTLLTKSDAKILASRLSQIGPLNLRDIDDAQRQIVELTAKLHSSSQNRTRTVRAAA